MNLIVHVGTEAGFLSNEDLFYGSTHQTGAYPATGPDPTPFIGEKALSPLYRRIVNRHLRPGPMSRLDFREKWLEILEELELFGPEVIIISAGSLYLSLPYFFPAFNKYLLIRI